MQVRVCLIPTGQIKTFRVITIILFAGQSLTSAAADPCVSGNGSSGGKNNNNNSRKKI